MPRTTVEIVVNDLVSSVVPRIGNATLGISQSTCPVITGDLLASLYLTYSKDGFTLGAAMPYAHMVEEGTPAVSASGKYVAKIKRFKRTLPSGRKVMVRAHTKTFTNMKPVLLNEAEDPSNQIWRTIGNSAGREGSHFMRNAMAEGIRIGIASALRQLGAK